MSEEKVPGTVSVPMADPEETTGTSPYDAGVEDLSNVKINTGGDPEIPFVDPKELTGNEDEETEEDQIEEPVKEEAIAEQRVSDDEVEDTELITPFVDAFAQELGWEFEDDERPQTIKELVEYIQATVDENSEPEFASEEIALLNEYVANGGDIRDYIDQVAAMDYDDVDVSSTTNQRRIVEQNLRLMGYDDNRIRRTIARYEDADVLREEAEDALDILKGRAMEEREQLVIEQQREQQEILDMQQQIYEDVSATVQNIDSIRGIPIAKADRQKLMNYIFTVGSDGQTQYQRDYSSDLTKNLIESAYFTMKGDSIIKSAKSSAQSEAVRALREQLRTSSIKTKSTVSTNKGADMDALSSFARGLGVR